MKQVEKIREWLNEEWHELIAFKHTKLFKFLYVNIK